MPNYDATNPLIALPSRYAYIEVGGRETPTEQYYILGGIRTLSNVGPRQFINGSHKGTGFPVYIEESNMADRVIRTQGIYMRDKDETAFTPADVNITTNRITLGSAPFTENERVRFGTDGTLPTPLVSGQNYYVGNPDATSLELKLNYDSASPVDLTDQGTGAEHRIWRRNPMDDIASSHTTGRWINIRYVGPHFYFLTPIGGTNACLVLEFNRSHSYTEVEQFDMVLQTAGGPIDWNDYPGPL